jgi:serine/threonine-protein kinase haspin
MRGFVYTGNALDETIPPVISGIWSEFTPKTNLIWLLFILKTLRKDKALNPVFTPSRTAYPPIAMIGSPAKRTPLTPCLSKGNIRKVALVKPKSECSDPKLEKPNVQTKADPRSKSASLADEQLERIYSTLEQDLSRRLDTVLELLDLEHGREDMCCAADLVAFAMDMGWLDQHDFFLS